MFKKKKFDYNKITRTLSISLSGNTCNLRCEYCLVHINDKNRSEYKVTIPKYNYDLDVMLKAFEPERIGGISLMAVAADGEPFLDEIFIPFIQGLLKQGHVVLTLSNLTLNNKVDELLNFDKKYLKRLVVKGSLHWNELKRLNKVDDFFNNINKIINAGASSWPCIVAGESYMPHLDEIIETSKKYLGVAPHAYPCFTIDKNITTTCPDCTDEFIDFINKKFDSKIFELGAKMYKYNPNKLFCYAGEYGIEINLEDGAVRKCGGCPVEGNFFKNFNLSKLKPIGNNCRMNSCWCRTDYIPQGFIPELELFNNETFIDVLDKGNLFNDEIKKLLNFKYSDRYKKYCKKEQVKINAEIDYKFRLARIKDKKINLKNKIRLKLYCLLKSVLLSKKIIKD